MHVAGKAYHSVEYKDPGINGIEGQRVVVVGIGNSAVDVACNAASAGKLVFVLITTYIYIYLFKAS